MKIINLEWIRWTLMHSGGYHRNGINYDVRRVSAILLLSEKLEINFLNRRNLAWHIGKSSFLFVFASQKLIFPTESDISFGLSSSLRFLLMFTSKENLSTSCFGSFQWCHSNWGDGILPLTVQTVEEFCRACVSNNHYPNIISNDIFCV